MTNTTQKIAELETKLTAIQEELNKLKQVESDVTWPKIGDTFYYISTYGAIDAYSYEGCGFDKDVQALGNMFRTQEDAEKELEARKVIAELRMQPRIKKFEPRKDNFSVVVNLDRTFVGYGLWHSDAWGFGQVYFNTAEDAENAIDTVGKDRILAAAKWLAMGL